MSRSSKQARSAKGRGVIPLTKPAVSAGVAPVHPPVTVSLSSDGDHFRLNLGSHTVGVRVPAGADRAAVTARKELTKLAKQMEDGGRSGLASQLLIIRQQVAIAEKALAGLALVESVLLARDREPTAKINSLAVPTQSLVDAYLKAGGRIEDAQARAERQFEEKYGMDLNELISLVEGT